MNRIPVVNDVERKTYGAPTTEVDIPMSPGVAEVVAAVKRQAAAKEAPKKKPAAKAKAKK